MQLLPRIQKFYVEFKITKLFVIEKLILRGRTGYLQCERGLLYQRMSVSTFLSSTSLGIAIAYIVSHSTTRKI